MDIVFFVCFLSAVSCRNRAMWNGNVRWPVLSERTLERPFSAMTLRSVGSTMISLGSSRSVPSFMSATDRIKFDPPTFSTLVRLWVRSTSSEQSSGAVRVQHANSCARCKQETSVCPGRHTLRSVASGCGDKRQGVG